jgi:hypothetical protein
MIDVRKQWTEIRRQKLGSKEAGKLKRGILSILFIPVPSALRLTPLAFVLLSYTSNLGL